jgi:hypothetical protein
MFGIKSLHRFNQTIHGSVSPKTMDQVKTATNGLMAAKGVKDCVVSYQCNDLICFTVSAVGTTADIGNFVCGNVPGLKKAAPVATFVSVGCKSFVHFCRTGQVRFSCNDPI